MSEACSSQAALRSGASRAQLLTDSGPSVSSSPANYATCQPGPLGSDSDAGGSLRDVCHPHPRKGRAGGLDRGRAAMPPQGTPPLPP